MGCVEGPLVADNLRGCDAPLNITNGRFASGNCTARCALGYLPSEAILRCYNGILTPATYSCEKTCAAPVAGPIPNASLGCAEGAQVASGSNCTPRCALGMAPTMKSLRCDAGVLTPASSSCEMKCQSPVSIQNAALFSCAEGAEIASGSSCTAACATHHTPSVGQLACSNG